MLIMSGKREDGRGLKDLREISCEVGVLPCAHGSALFTRGETQALVTCTLGTSIDEQRVEGLKDEYRKKFMLDYNFPPFCVGEAKPPRSPSRREVGHGNLAEVCAPGRPAAARTVRLHHPRRLRHPRIQRLLLAGLRLRRDARHDGRRRAARPPGRGRGDGPRPGRRPGEDPDRHQRRRGPLRRHGPQDRRHAPGHHRHPDGPEGLRHQGRHAHGGVPAGARRAGADPRADADGD